MPGYHPAVLAALTVLELRAAVRDAERAGHRSARIAKELSQRGVDRETVARVRETATRWFASHDAAIAALQAKEKS